MAEHIFQALMDEGGEMAGAFAYTIYKRHKVEWTVQYMADHGGQLPDAAALDTFRTMNLLPHALHGYLERGRALSQQVLTMGTEKKINEIKVEVALGALAATMKEDVRRQFDERKTMRGWMRDAATGIIANMVALLIIGALILGAKSLDDINAAVGRWAKGEPAREGGAGRPLPAPGAGQQGAGSGPGR
ncbi:MAG TPA: hypothetical protein VFT05_01425 [Burkholderiaceae bacterium]|nr:hypothetical protein [Burkholderiaceae bacterium]